jgi:hypothetical protein
VNQGPRGDCLMKKTEGRKSRDTVPLKTISATKCFLTRWCSSKVSFSAHWDLKKGWKYFAARSSEFGYGFEAVMIRVKQSMMNQLTYQFIGKSMFTNQEIINILFVVIKLDIECWSCSSGIFSSDSYSLMESLLPCGSLLRWNSSSFVVITRQLQAA